MEIFKWQFPKTTSQQSVTANNEHRKVPSFADLLEQDVRLSREQEKSPEKHDESSQQKQTFIRDDSDMNLFEKPKKKKRPRKSTQTETTPKEKIFTQDDESTENSRAEYELLFSRIKETFGCEKMVALLCKSFTIEELKKILNFNNISCVKSTKEKMASQVLVLIAERKMRIPNRKPQGNSLEFALNIKPVSDEFLEAFSWECDEDINEMIK